MPQRTAPDRTHEGTAGFPVPLNVVLLASAGLALIGAGVLLTSRSGALVSLGDTVLTAIAWCL